MTKPKKSVAGPHSPKAEPVVILCGGDKSSQRKDISKAKGYWMEYQEEKR